MIRFLGIRLVQALLGLLVLSLVVFLSAHVSGDPASYYLNPNHATQAEYERLKALLGLDRPLHVQYGSFILGALHGDFGDSIYYRRPVSELLLTRIPATLQLSLTAMVLALAVGIPLGVVAAIRRGTLVDRVATVMSIVWMSAPQFWVGILLLTFFAGYLGVLPSFGSGGLQHLVLPATTLALYLIAGIVRLTRSSMIDAMESDYVRFARMKGLPNGSVVWKHALRNALIPVVTFSGIMLGAMLNGTIVVEQLFAWPGIGRLAVGSVFQRDFPVLQATVLIGGAFFIVTSYLVDLLYAALDPRIRTA